MIDIKYVDGGNAIKPQGEGFRYIIHCCNDIGKFGAGFALAVANKWPNVKRLYQNWAKDTDSFKLGQIQQVKVDDDLYVINMIGQRSVGQTVIGDRVFQPVRHECIDECLARVFVIAKAQNASIHMPRICCGLAGSTWDKIEPMIHNNFILKGISVTVYDYQP